jgi:hypothetical protein
MHITYSNNTLKIDNGDHYYTGQVTKSMFPESIADEFEDIIVKSFEDFSDDNTNIKHTINETEYIIEFKFISKLLKLSETIKINIFRKEKDFKDYINERIEKLEKDNQELKDKMAELVTIILKNDEELEKSEESEKSEKSEESEDDEDDDDEPEETKFVSAVVKGKTSISSKAVPSPKPSRGGKKVATL